MYVQRLMDLATVSTFKRLGAGSFATVFVSEARGGVVVKQVKAPGNANLLCKEHADLEMLYRECMSPGSFFQLPRPFGFYSDYWTFARKADLPRTLDLGLPPHSMYVMQRMWPVPISFVERIRHEFFSDAAKQESVPPFLARLYLGRAKSRAAGRFFCAENFPLDTARMEQLGLPCDAIAAGMGQMLGCINFRGGRDGRDIEFVLCGDMSNPLSGRPSYGCIDFNQMRPHKDNPGNIVDSIVSNDPYYPKPSSLYWGSFVAAYEAEAAAAGGQEAEEANCKELQLARAVVGQLAVHWHQC